MADWQQRVRERAYAVWEAEGQRHGNDLSHWFRAEVEIPLRVTFDSNAYRQVVNPGSPRDASSSELQKIHEALKAGRVLGYLSESLVTLEGIQNKDRVNVLGSTRLERHSRSTGKHTITLSLTLKQNRKPLDPVFSRWVQDAQKLGMRFLRAGEPWFSGAGHIRDDGDTFFEPDASELALAERMGKVNAVDSAIAALGLGRSRGILLGREFSKRDGVADEWWLWSLKRASNAQEHRKAELAVNEWADAASIAAHIGYQIDLFCSEDRKGASVLDRTHRAWLTSTYGVKFVRLTELAAMV